MTLEGFLLTIPVQLGKRKQVTVRKFNNINLVDIREYYIDKSTGETKPGKKGISLTEDSWNQLIQSQNKIQAALDKLAGRSSQSTSALEAIPLSSKDAPSFKKSKTLKAAAGENDEDQPKAVAKPKKTKAKKPESESESDFDEDIDDLVKELESDED